MSRWRCPWIASVVSAYIAAGPVGAATLTWPQSNPSQPCFGVGLQSCIGVAQPGDVVQVGTCTPINENLTIDKSLTLRAVTGVTPVLSPFRTIFLYNPSPKTNVITVQDFTLQQGRVFAVQDSPGMFNVTMRDLDVLNAVNGFTELEVRAGQQGGPHGAVAFDIANNDLTIPANSQFSGAEAIGIIGINLQSVTGTIRNNRIRHFDGGQVGAINLYNDAANPFDVDVIANDIRGDTYNQGINLSQFGSGSAIVRYLDNLVVGQVSEAGAPGAYVINVVEGNATFEIANNTAADSDNGIVVNGRDDLGGSWSGSVANNIVARMSSIGMSIEQPMQTPGVVTNDHNLVFDALHNFFTPGPGTVFRDPLFVGGTDYRLSDVSPACNNGDPARVPADLSTDLDGNPRQVDTVDIGAYESNTPEPPCFTDIGAGLPGVFGLAQASVSLWGDYDNDGDLDLLLTGNTGSGAIARVYRNSGGANPTFTDIGAGLAGGVDGGAAWGDYDNDGDLDVVLANPGLSRVYRNSGGPNPTFVDLGATLPAAARSAVAWGDCDQDGDLDLLIAGADGSSRFSRIYLNSGGANPTFSELTGVSLAGVDYASLAWGDYDNDRDLDILLAGFDGATSITKVYRNNGTTTPSFTDVGAALPGVHTGAVAWGDYDNDGDLDILLTGSMGGLPIARVYRNGGGANPFFSDAGLPLAGVQTSSAAWSDYDNDGDLDILLTGYDSSADEILTRLYRSNGGTVPTFATITTGSFAIGTGAVAWGDHDGDGDLDFLLTGFDGTTGVTRVYSNGCATTANTPPATPAGLSATGGTRATFRWDPAADGQTPSAGLTYNLRIGTTPGGSELVSPMANSATGSRHVAALGNANHNTSLELAIPGPGTYYWSVQSVDGAFAGSAFAGEQTLVVPLCFSDMGVGMTGVHMSAAAWGDYDNDGDLDALLCGGGSPQAFLYRNSGGPNPTFSDANVGIPAAPGSAVAWGDYDKDGDLDIAFAGGNQTRIYRNSGGADPVFVSMGSFFGVGFGSVAWGDYDNDDDLDLLVTGQDSGGFGVTRLYRNNGGPNPTFAEMTGGLPGVGQSAAAWGDYDNDNDLDILITGTMSSNNRIARIYRNNGAPNPTFMNSAATLPGVSRSSVAWGDYDNDGDLDILMAGYTGSVGLTRVYRNSGGGNPTFTDIAAGLPAAALPSSAGSVAWGDFDRDGRLDILLTGADIGRVYRNSGGTDPTFSDIGAFLLPVQSGAAAWGDYDNDGDLDILHTGLAQGVVGPIARVYRNLCGLPSKAAGEAARVAFAGPNTPPASPTELFGRIDGTLARFSWNAGTDGQTPSHALSYNLRVGTSPGASDIVSPMANPVTGFRRLPALLGNVHQNTTWEVRLPAPGTYYWSVQAVDGGSAGSVFAIEETPVDVLVAPGSADYTLAHRGTNPFSCETALEFSQPANGRVKLAIYDLAGHRVRLLADVVLQAGRGVRSWDGRDDAGRRVASGIYFARLETPAAVKTTKLALVR